MAEQNEISLDCPHRVALDLAKIIAANEDKDAAGREYWLKLYVQCMKAVRLRPLEDILQNK